MAPVPDIPSTPQAYLRAGRDGARQSLGWYDNAGQSARRFAREHVLPLDVVVAVLALTSPRISVLENVKVARTILLDPAGPEAACERGTVNGRRLLPNVRASLLHWFETRRETGRGVIRGPKTEAFARAILGDESAVVVDVWVWRALGWTGRPEGKRYARAVACIRGLATREGLTPREAQACIWYGARHAAGWTGGSTALDFYATA